METLGTGAILAQVLRQFGPVWLGMMARRTNGGEGAVDLPTNHRIAALQKAANT